jgi:hypothetical protein
VRIASSTSTEEIMTMSRYVKADMIGCPCGYCEGYDECQKEVDEAPSIDIVFCEECKHWEESQYYPEFMVCTYVLGATFTRQHDDFCSRGERKDEQTEREGE